MSKQISTIPLNIRFDRQGRKMFVAWNDGHKSEFGFKTLRAICPCATCEELRLSLIQNPLRVIPKSQAATDVDLVAYRPVGSYAITFDWSDGHGTGIYPYAFLRQNCKCPSCSGKNQ